jgi:hypothetical protein
MENNVRIVENSQELSKGAAELAERCLSLAQDLISKDGALTSINRGGRKAHRLDGEQ